ncbi:MAG: extracellular solute-binding protein family 1 [Bacilli bacterium]|nr:extracellular solute-binding protein family 1 [Bacilli bacterium]
MKKNRLFLLLVLLSCLSLLAACGNNQSSNAAAALDTTTPATLVFYSTDAMPDDQFNQQIGDYVRKQFPNYTINYIQKKPGVTDLTQLIASNTQIDIYFDSGTFFSNENMAGFQYDMTSLIKKSNINLSRFETTSMDLMNKMSKSGISGLPVWSNDLVLYYNKDVFDKFGIQYPKNGMTWDQTLSLAKQFNKVQDGKQYLGIAVSPVHFFRLNQYSLPYVDSQTNTSAINNDKWKQLIQALFIDPASDQGYKSEIARLKDKLPYKTEFVGQELAMFVNLADYFPQIPANSINWDLASLPTLKDLPGIGSQAYPIYFGITSNSKYKDQAMNVIKYLTSDDYQTAIARQGLLPSVTSDAIKKQIGADNPMIKNKNTSAFTYNKFAPMSVKSDYDDAVEKIYTDMLIPLSKGSVDINSAFRDAEDKANKAIQTAKSNK